jgi:PAS domain S-box-containing protein
MLSCKALNLLPFRQAFVLVRCLIMNAIDCKKNTVPESALLGRKGHLADGLAGAKSPAARFVLGDTQFAQKRDLLLRTLIDTLPDYVYAKDAEGRFIIANVAVARQMGYSSPDEIIGKSDFDLFPLELAERYRVEEQKIIESGHGLHNHEGPTVDESKAEKNRWVSTTKVILRDAQGKVTGFIGLGVDITERKQMEDALIRERALMRTLIDSLPDAIYTKDTAGRKTMANLADLKNQCCKTEVEVIGKTDFEIFPKDIAEKFWADDQKVIHGQPVMNREEHFFDEAGRENWLLTSKLPLRDPDGNITGLVGIGRDITERKQMEDALIRERVLMRTLIDSLPDHIYAKDKQGRFILNNLAHAQNLCAASPEELKGKSDFDYFPRELAEQFYADEQRIIATGESVINQEQYKARPGDKDGIKTWSLSSKVIWRDQDGDVLGTVGVTRDIHGFKMAEEALRSSEEKLRQFTAQLERSNRELQDFAYVASHDLQEPLRKIVVFGDRLKEKCGETLVGEPLDYLERMQKAASRMQTLINDLLTFSRVTSKARPFAPVNLAEVARGVVGDLEARIELVKGRVEIGMLPVIDAEELQMRQLLQNLIGNALKFRRPEAEPVVKVTARTFADETGRELCELTVSDNGIGFEEKYLDRIFNVFQRLHSRGEFEGNGMGLAIVKKIALYHGGDITAKSQPGVGTTFILTLPTTHPKINETDNPGKNHEN